MRDDCNHDNYDLDTGASWDLGISGKSSQEDGKVETKFIWRLNPFAFRTLARTIHNNWRNISTHSGHLDFFVVRVQGRDKLTINELPTSSLCGLTLGIGQIFGYTCRVSTNLSMSNFPLNTASINHAKLSSNISLSCVVQDTRSETETERFVKTTRELSADDETSTGLRIGSHKRSDRFQNTSASKSHTFNKLEGKKWKVMLKDDTQNVHQQLDRKASKSFICKSQVAHLDAQHWMEIDASLFKVRSKTYLSNRLKVPSCSNLLRLITVDFIEVSSPIMTGICSHPNERIQSWLAAEKGLDKEENPLYDIDHHQNAMPKFVLCINFVIPGPPHYHFVMYFAVDDFACLGIHGEGTNNNKEPHSKLLDNFLFGPSDEFRNEVLKIIPRIVKGNIFLKGAVGNTPVLLGQRLKPTYVQTDRFLEVIIDVSTHAMTERLLKLATAYGSETVAEFGFVLEGKTEQTLPENILGSIRLQSSGFDGKIRFVDGP